MALIGEIVVDDEGGFAGMLTDRDIVIRVTAEGGDARTVTVVDSCPRDLTSIEDAAASELVGDAVFREVFRAIAAAYRSKASHICHGHERPAALSTRRSRAR